MSFQGGAAGLRQRRPHRASGKDSARVLKVVISDNSGSGACPQKTDRGELHPMMEPAADADTRVATLPNGVRVVAIRLPHLESCSVSVFVRTGSRHESRSLNGISHFAEHMAFKGTE